MMEEIWKPIKGYEGIYEVSSYGRVRSLDRYDGRGIFKRGKVLRLQSNGRKGYKTVRLYLDGRQHQPLVHRLVAEAFIPNPDRLPDINHRDEDRANNLVENLEWCTKKYNNNYGHHHERMKEALRWQFRKVMPTDADGRTVACHESVSAAARAVGVTAKAIRNVIQGIKKTAGGYRWQYVETEPKTE